MLILPFLMLVGCLIVYVFYVISCIDSVLDSVIFVSIVKSSLFDCLSDSVCLYF